MAEIPHPGDAAEVSTTPVVIIGAGMSGLCMGIELSKHGIPFVILEKSQDVGGTWLHNTNPGCACDGLALAAAEGVLARAAAQRVRRPRELGHGVHPDAGDHRT